MLSKYTAILLPVSAFIFLIGCDAHRHWLVRIQPWLAVAIGLLIFSPVIYWNSQNEWISFLFQTARATHLPESHSHFSIFWLFQAGAVMPPVLALFAMTLIYSIRSGLIKQDHAWKLAIAFAGPLFLVFLGAAFSTEVHLNWTAPAYLSLIPVTVEYCGRLANTYRAHQTATQMRLISISSGIFCIVLLTLMFSILLTPSDFVVF